MFKASREEAACLRCLCLPRVRSTQTTDSVTAQLPIVGRDSDLDNDPAKRSGLGAAALGQVADRSSIVYRGCSFLPLIGPADCLAAERGAALRKGGGFRPNIAAHSCAVTSSTCITSAPRAHGNFNFTASAISPEATISAVPAMR